MMRARSKGKLLMIAALAAIAIGVVFKLSNDDVVAIEAGGVGAAIARIPTGRDPVRGFVVNPPAKGESAPAPAAAPTVDEAACTACEKSNIAAGDCEPDSGCDGLTGEDQQLCLKALACMRKTNCWSKHPLDCLCGTAEGVACAQGAANGDCKDEIQAATKTTDPIKNGTLFFDPTVPAGRATRLIACAYDKCKSVCAAAH